MPSNAFTLVTQVGSLGYSLDSTPIGAIQSFASETPSDRWLPCDGAAISRTTYADLFAVIGTVFGAGDGSTTFNLPDLRGEFLRGWDNGRGVDSGRAIGTLQGDQMADHQHAAPVTFGSNNIYYNTGYPFGTSTLYPSLGTNKRDGSTGLSASQPAALTSTPELPSGETRPRNVAVLYCIFTGVSTS